MLITKFTLVDKNVLFKALDEVKSLTCLKGRWQILCEYPLIVCDIGHNEAGIQEIIRNIKYTNFEKLFIIIGFVKDKDIDKILTLLPQNATYFFSQAPIPRALDAETLCLKAQKMGLIGETIYNVNEALNKAKSLASNKDMIFVGGSNFLVAELDNL